MLSPPKKITELPSKTATPDPKDTAQIEYLYVSALSFRLRDSTALQSCTFGTRSRRDSPEFLHIRFYVVIPNISTVFILLRQIIARGKYKCNLCFCINNIFVPIEHK